MYASGFRCGCLSLSVPKPGNSGSQAQARFAAASCCYLFWAIAFAAHSMLLKKSNDD